MVEHEFDPFSEQVVSVEPRAVRVRRNVVRTGSVVIFIGLLIALAGAAQRARSGDAPGSIGRTVHHTGQMVMLGGLCVVLLAYRVRWFLEMSTVNKTTNEDHNETVIARRDEEREVTRTKGPTAPSDTGRSILASVISLILASLACIMALVLVVFAPNNLAGMFLAFFVPALTVGLVITIIYGSTLQRTFCIGALIPWSTVVIIQCAFWLRVLGTGLNWRGLRSGGQALRWLKFQGSELLMALDGLGAMLRLPLVVMLFAALFAGLFAVLVRSILHGMNQKS